MEKVSLPPPPRNNTTKPVTSKAVSSQYIPTNANYICVYCSHFHFCFLISRLFKIGYVPQSPWLLNGTLKQNIIFGHPFHDKQFLRVLELCALKGDVNAMPKKEFTIIGDRGVTLSGGQKQRIMIARMLYSNPDVMILVKGI